jgi:hypothetical protein
MTNLEINTFIFYFNKNVQTKEISFPLLLPLFPLLLFPLLLLL